MKRHMSRSAIARELGTTWRRVDQAIRYYRLAPCTCGRLCYDLDNATEAIRLVKAHDAESQKEATLAVAEMRRLAGDDALVRWAEDVIGPLVRAAKGR